MNRIVGLLRGNPLFFLRKMYYGASFFLYEKYSEVTKIKKYGIIYLRLTRKKQEGVKTMLSVSFVVYAVASYILILAGILLPTLCKKSLSKAELLSEILSIGAIVPPFVYLIAFVNNRGILKLISCISNVPFWIYLAVGFVLIATGKITLELCEPNDISEMLSKALIIIGIIVEGLMTIGINKLF